MDISRIRELGGVDATNRPAQTVAEVLIENKATGVSEQTNRLRKMAGLPPAAVASATIVTEGIEDQHADVMGMYDDRGDTLSNEDKKQFHRLSSDFDKAHEADDDEAMADICDAMKQLFP